MEFKSSSKANLAGPVFRLCEHNTLRADIMLVPTRAASASNPRTSRAYTDDDVELSVDRSLTDRVSAVFQRSKVLESDRAKMKRHARMTAADVQRSGLAQITISHLDIFGSTLSAMTRSGHHEGDGARDESPHRPRTPSPEPSESVSIDSVLTALDTIISDEIHNGVGILYNMHATVYLAHALVALVDRVREVHDAKPAVDKGHDATPAVDEKAQSCVRLSHCLRLFSRLLEFESKVDKKLRRQPRESRASRGRRAASV